MVHNNFFRSLQIYGALLSVLLLFGIYFIDYLSDITSNKTKYEMNQYFYNTTINRIIIYNDTSPDIKKLCKDIVDSKIINEFLQNINKSEEYYPDHPQYRSRFLVRVLIGEEKYYDFEFYSKYSDYKYIYIADLNNNRYYMKNKYLHLWFSKNKLY